MTNDELFALPDVTPEIVSTERIIDGRKIMFPEQVGFAGLLWREEETPISVIDHNGTKWEIGFLLGTDVESIMVRRRMAERS